MTLILQPLTEDDALRVKDWRLTCRESLRTPYDLTDAQQRAWYQDVVCDRRSLHRFWGIWLQEPWHFVGQAALEHITRHDAEIGLLLDPARRGQGLGQEAMRLTLAEAFDVLNLRTVWGECYLTNPAAVHFWTRETARYGGSTTTWPRRKFWGGVLYDALLFTITEEGWRAASAVPR